MDVRWSILYLPLRWIKCARWTFFTFVLINILSFSLFFKHNSSKLIISTYVVQDDTATANNSLLTSIKCLFIVRSDNKNLELRNAIRKSWYNDGTVKDINYSLEKTIDAKLIFIIENLRNAANNYGSQDLQFNDTFWIPNSGPGSIKSVKFLEVVPTAHYYIIGLDTTFINFNNVKHFLQRQGKFITVKIYPHMH